MRQRLPSYLISMPLRRRVACSELIGVVCVPSVNSPSYRKKGSGRFFVCPTSTARKIDPTPFSGRMGSMPWDPMRDLLTMQERLESLFGQAAPGWTPPVDLAEFDDRFVLTVELPGLARADVQVDYRDQVLTIRGERPADACCPERYQQFERGHGPFTRSFRFATPVAQDQITADLADGVLTIVAPKMPSRRITIET